jgi:dTMP kinase
MASGRFITFEGGEGSGKSTQARLLAERLRARGIDTILTREPGGSPFAERVRRLILDPSLESHSVLAEALLFYAARADHLEKLIRPRLAQGGWVISDRFSDSTRVYQSAAGGLPIGIFDALEQIVVAPTRPDLTLVLDIAPEVGLQRATERRIASLRSNAEPDAFEKRDLGYHQHLREGFAAVAMAHPQRCVMIDGTMQPEAIAAEIWTHIERRFFPGPH